MLVPERNNDAHISNNFISLRRDLGGEVLARCDGSCLKALSTVTPALMSAADSLSGQATRKITFVSTMPRAAFQPGS